MSSQKVNYIVQEGKYADEQYKGHEWCIAYPLSALNRLLRVGFIIYFSM